MNLIVVLLLVAGVGFVVAVGGLLMILGDLAEHDVNAVPEPALAVGKEFRGESSVGFDSEMA
jgi:hypothetical protein